MTRVRNWTFALLAVALSAGMGCGDDDTPPPIIPPDGPPRPDANMSNPDGNPGMVIYEGAKAHWLTRGLIAVPADLPGSSFALYYAPEGGLAFENSELFGGAALELTEDSSGVPAEIAAKFPHLADFRALRLADSALQQVPELLKAQLAVAGTDARGKFQAVTSVQTPGVIDELYTYDGQLGLSFTDRKPSFRLWAPTARSVTLHVYDKDSKAELAAQPMVVDVKGVWSYEAADAAWYGHYYKYEVEVFAPAAGTPDPSILPGAVVKNLVTDPYSVGLATNSAYSLIIDLDDPDTKPAGWDTLQKPALAAPEDVVLYELHIRDFSIFDPKVPAEHKGKYLAFTYDGKDDADDRELSNGMEHLASLAEAGLTHVHLLPVFDIATIEEDPTKQVTLDSPIELACERSADVPQALCMANQGKSVGEVLSQLRAEKGGATEEVQALVFQLRDLDAFNWGYDPYHYTAPEGSYATNTEGAARIAEFRAMVQALSQSGLRTVMDVVYNHTNASGQSEKSVLDRVVPGYYHRRNPITGDIERSTCCENTATEHAMMEKLMLDSLVTWARDYKVDGFRFDLMGHHMKSNMERVKQRLQSLTPAEDGVDGAKIYVYGEGWDFGEVGNNTRGINATQGNLAGTGIGTFSDRLRDAVRGGGPFDSKEALRKNQGFINGMFYDPNELNSAVPDEKAILLEQSDQIRVGMAGNMRDFVLTDRTGTDVAGSSVDYNGSPAGYTEDPQEVITYVAAHDNQTLFDNNQYKLPTAASMATRVRVQNLGLSITMLAQGVPFLHAGEEILRSKSMERDSFNSGDWFNKIDFTYQTNNWNVGLPTKDKDGDNYGIIKAIIANALIAPASEHILDTLEHTREMLRIRKSTRLFRLEAGADVAKRVDFYNAGPSQIPGLIVMTVTDGTCAGADLDPALDGVVVLINASDETQTFSLAGTALEGETGFTLHPVQQASADAVVRQAAFEDAAFTIPARTVAVFQQAQAGAQGDGLACNTKVAKPPIPVPAEFSMPVYLRGEMNDWGTTHELAKVADYTYEVTVALEARTYQFKIASMDWSTYSFGKGNAVVRPGEPLTLQSKGDNAVLEIATAGSYRIRVSTATGIKAPVLTVEAAN